MAETSFPMQAHDDDVQQKPPPLENAHLLITTPTGEDGTQVASTLAKALSPAYKVVLMETLPSSAEMYRKELAAKSSHARKVAIIITK